MKIFKSVIINVIFLISVIFCCTLFSLPKNKIADAIKSEILNERQIEIVTSTGTTRMQNYSLIKKGTSDYIGNYIYSPIHSNGNNTTMSFSFDNTNFGDNQALYIWVYIPTAIVQDLSITISNSSSEMSWVLSGIEIDEKQDNTLSLVDMIEQHNGKISRGWKLLALSKNDGTIKKGSELNSFSLLKINYGFLSVSETEDDKDFSICYPFLADKQFDKSVIADSQSYIVYAEKNDFIKENTTMYLGDKITINSIKDVFVYAVIGKQNIITNPSGYVWNVSFTLPSGNIKTLALDKKIEIVLENAGYYLLDITLTNIEQDYVPIISRLVNIKAEPFVFGYFDKSSFNIAANKTTVIDFNLSKDFEFDVEDVNIQIDNNQIISTYFEIINNQIRIYVSAENVGNTNLKLFAIGKQKGKSNSEEYSEIIKINVLNEKNETNTIILWATLGVLMVGIVTYIIILFVKSRRFGVK